MKFSMVGLSVIAMSIATLPAVGQVKREFVHERDLETGMLWQKQPAWAGEGLLGFYANDSAGPVIFSIDREGRKDEFLFTLKDAAKIRIYSVARSQKGEVALAGSAYTTDLRGATFVARIAPGFERQTVIRTWPYCPAVVALGEDGVLWAVGNLKNEDGTADVITGHLLRRYDPAGKMLSSKQIAIRDFQGAGDDATYLRASRDRVGWLTGPEYIEFALDGSETGRYPVPGATSYRDVAGLAMADDGNVVISCDRRDKYELLQLDREKGVWVRLVLPHSPPPWTVLGFDGTTLVGSTGNGRLSRFASK